MGLRLKKRRKGEDFKKGECAVARCHAKTDVVDGTKRQADCDVPLCAVHWAIYAADDDEEQEYEFLDVPMGELFSYLR